MLALLSLLVLNPVCCILLTGIGRATVLALARCGAEVTAVTRTQADLNSLVLEVMTPTALSQTVQSRSVTTPPPSYCISAHIRSTTMHMHTR